jgi:ABC-type branched-subunit amino acid transport system ATPase component
MEGSISPSLVTGWRALGLTRLAHTRATGPMPARLLTVVLVEQSVPTALAAAERDYVLQTGRIVAEGPSHTLLESDLVHRAYPGM